MLVYLNGFIVECFIVLGIYGIGGFLRSRILGHKWLETDYVFKYLHLNGIALCQCNAFKMFYFFDNLTTFNLLKIKDEFATK